jgi:hypothetical protein
MYFRRGPPSGTQLGTSRQAMSQPKAGASRARKAGMSRAKEFKIKGIFITSRVNFWPKVWVGYMLV